MKKQTELRKAFTVDTIDVFTECTHRRLSHYPTTSGEAGQPLIPNRKPRLVYVAIIAPLGRMYMEDTKYVRSRYQAIKEARRIIRRCYLPTGKEYLKGLDVNPIDIEA